MLAATNFRRPGTVFKFRTVSRDRTQMRDFHAFEIAVCIATPRFSQANRVQIFATGKNSIRWNAPNQEIAWRHVLWSVDLPTDS